MRWTRGIAVALFLFFALVTTGAVTEATTAPEAISIGEIVDAELAATLTLAVEEGLCTDAPSAFHCYTLNSGFDDGWFWEISQCVWDDGSYAASCFINSCQYGCNLPRSFCYWPE